jgi:hypothetical protein
MFFIGSKSIENAKYLAKNAKSRKKLTKNAKYLAKNAKC